MATMMITEYRESGDGTAFSVEVWAVATDPSKSNKSRKLATMDALGLVSLHEPLGATFVHDMAHELTRRFR